MSFFKEHRFASFSLILLVILNLSLISLIVIDRFDDRDGRDRHRDRDRKEDFIARRLDLTEAQKKQFHQLREAHAAEMELLNKELYQKRKELFTLIANGADDSLAVRSLTADIGESVGQIERSTFTFFNEVYALCTPVQQEKLSELLRSVAKRRGPPGGDGMNGTDRRFRRN